MKLLSLDGTSLLTRGGRRRLVMRLRLRLAIAFYARVNRQLLQLWVTRWRLATSRKPCVLYFADSTAIFVSPDDVDNRRLPAMIADAIAPSHRFLPIVGAGYHMDLYRLFVKALPLKRGRPAAIVLPLCIRTTISTHILGRPNLHYDRTMELLQRANGRRIPCPVQPDPNGPDLDYATYEALPISTKWRGDCTIGYFRQRLKGRQREIFAGGPDADELERLMFDYFHGERARCNPAALESWSQLGAELKALGIPVVVYRNPVPTEEGERLYPGEFESHVQENLDAIEDAFRSGFGANTIVVNPQLHETANYIDARDGTEHLNEEGRSALARAIVNALRPAFS